MQGYCFCETKYEDEIQIEEAGKKRDECEAQRCLVDNCKKCVNGIVYLCEVCEENFFSILHKKECTNQLCRVEVKNCEKCLPNSPRECEVCVSGFYIVSTTSCTNDPSCKKLIQIALNVTPGINLSV